MYLQQSMQKSLEVGAAMIVFDILLPFLIGLLICGTPGFILYLVGAKHGIGCGGWGWQWLWKRETPEQVTERMRKHGCL